MRKVPLLTSIFIFILCSFNNISLAQAPLQRDQYKKIVIDSFTNVLKRYHETYNCGIRDEFKKNAFSPLKNKTNPDPNLSGDRAFDSLFKPILSNVFIGSNDLVQDGPATSFVQDAEKGTLSINYSAFVSPKRKGFLNFGVFSKATNGLFGIYTTGSWSADIGTNLSYSWTRARGRNFQIEACDSLSKSGSRERYYFAVLSKLSELSYQRDSILHLRDSLKNRIDAKWRNLGSNFQDSAADYAKLSGTFMAADSIARLVASLTPQQSDVKNSTFYNNVVDSLMALFEVKNDIYTGYYVRWYSLRGSISNNSISPSTDSLDATVKSTFKSKNLLKASFGLNMNVIKEGRTYLLFFRIGADLGLHNYMDHPAIKKPFTKYDGAKRDFLLINENLDTLGYYQDLKPDILAFEPGLYVSTFWGKNKVLGVEFRADTKLPFEKPDWLTSSSYPATYSITIGPAFRLKKDTDISKGSIGVEVGFMDAPINKNAWDYFAAKFKVGVPFSALIK